MSSRRSRSSQPTRLSLSSLASAPLLSNFDEPIRSRRPESPLRLFESQHEDGMTVKRLSSRLKNCSVVFLVSSPAYPAAVALCYFTLSWFLTAMALMVAQALLGSTGFRVAKKRKYKKVARFAWWLGVFIAAVSICTAAYQVDAFNSSPEICDEAQLTEVCKERGGWQVSHLLLICVLPVGDLLHWVFLLYVRKVAVCFERALVNDLVGLNAAWEQ